MRAGERGLKMGDRRIVLVATMKNEDPSCPPKPFIRIIETGA